MKHELANVEILKAEQAEGNSIIDFKPNEQKKLAEEIQEEVKNLANSYWKFRDSIINFKVNKPNEEELKKEIEETTDPLEFRRVNASLIQSSKQEIIQNALKVICDNLDAQTAAIFLISKDGILERAGIYGWDKYGNSLDNDWFNEESYKIGEGFTGEAAEAQGNSKYGEIQFTQNLDINKLKLHNGAKYLEKLGELRCAIAIPLNGRNKTYGVIRVINKFVSTASKNKVGRKNTLSKDPFSQDDIRLLLFLSAHIANALSNFRRDIQAEIFKYLSRLLIQPHTIKESLKNVYQQVVDLLVQNPETAFKAGILRVKDDYSETLDIQAISLAPGVTDTRNNEPRKADGDDGFLWVIVENRKRLIIQDIKDDQMSQFKNREWIKANKFQSVGCFPLVAKDETVGTLSLYTGYNYEFYPDSVDFLQGIADLLASFMLNVKLEEQRRELQNAFTKYTSPHPLLDPQLVDPQIETKFKTLAEEWKRDTVAISSITQMLMHPAYLQIIGLGPRAIPLLLRELAENSEPDHWFSALRAITGENPVKPEQRGIVTQMRKAWLEWGKRQD